MPLCPLYRVACRKEKTTRLETLEADELVFLKNAVIAPIEVALNA